VDGPVSEEPRTVADLAAIRDVVGEPSELVLRKSIDHVDPHTARFIAHSPLVVVASSDADGRCDSSPRGDPPGFVRVVDPHRLLIPDRKGNRRVDTMRNVLENPHVGLLFLVPGSNDTVRINGTAAITDDPDLLAPSSVRGRAPALGLLVGVEEVFVHCARAFLRSKLWQPDQWPDRSALASQAAVVRDQLDGVLEVDERALADDLEQTGRDLY
jgi:PPOX class probable FMN-dependent enzyme